MTGPVAPEPVYCECYVPHLTCPTNLREADAGRAHGALTRLWNQKRERQYGPMTPAMSASLCPLVWSSLGAPMPGTWRSLRRLARVATAARAYEGAPQLASRWQGVVAFRVAKALTQLIDDSVGERPGDTVLPDWADGPPDPDDIVANPVTRTWGGIDEASDSESEQE